MYMLDAGLAVLIPIFIVAVLDLFLVGAIIIRRVETDAQRAFLALAVCVFLQQTLAVASYAHDLGLAPHFSNTLQYLFTVSATIFISGCMFFWFIYLRVISHDRTFHQLDLKLVCYIPIVVYSFMALTTPTTHWLFYFDETGVFHNGTIYYAQFICPLAYMLMALYMAFRMRHTANHGKVRRLMRNFFLFIVPSFLGSIVQLGFFRGGYSQIGISAGLLLLYLQTYLEEVNQNRYLRSVQVLNDQLRDAIETKTRFLNNMSHDIRTPMNAILGFADLIEKHKDDPVLVDDYLNKIKTSGEYLLTIINNVLDLARIESGKEKVDEAFFDLNDMENSAIPVLEPLIRQKKLHFETHMTAEHPYIWVDRTKVMQVTVNLLSNAVKYTPDGGSVSITMTEMPCDMPGYGKYVLKVSDTGVGMSPEFANHVFESFSRERNTTESKIIGTGLGMSIVKRLVDLMGGTITVHSQLGRGTTFTVTLLHRIVDNPELYLTKAQRMDSQQKSLEGKRVLLAEDNVLNAEIAIALLEDLGVEVTHVEDGVECVKQIIENPADRFDVILMDIQMPNLDGYLATRKIRRLEESVKANIPIIAMTANAFDDDRQLAIAAGMNAHLSKPVEVTKLLEALLDVI